jgi:hypothetical protein
MFSSKTRVDRFQVKEKFLSAVVCRLCMCYGDDDDDDDGDGRDGCDVRVHPMPKDIELVNLMNGDVYKLHLNDFDEKRVYNRLKKALLGYDEDKSDSDSESEIEIDDDDIEIIP